VCTCAWANGKTPGKPGRAKKLLKPFDSVIILCSIHEHNTIAQAAKMMDEKRVGCLLVFDSKK
jgi:hypothetical protein